LNLLEGKERGSRSTTHHSKSSLGKGDLLGEDFGIFCGFSSWFFLAYFPINFCSFGGILE
jgi:hypothetical protein